MKLNKDLWVNGSKDIAVYRNELLIQQGGKCAILSEPMLKPCLDHDHYDGKCRGVIGSALNMFEGGVQKLWSKHMEDKTSLTMSETLRRLADYLENDYSNNKFHGEIINDLKKALKRRTKETIVLNGLNNLGIIIDPALEKGDMISLYIAEFTKKLEESYLYESR